MMRAEALAYVAALSMATGAAQAAGPTHTGRGARKLLSSSEQ
jgi:hypothetical protein